MTQEAYILIDGQQPTAEDVQVGSGVTDGFAVSLEPSPNDQVPPGAPATPPDTTVPVIDNYSPAASSSIDAGDAISFDVTDNSGSFRRIIVTVTLAGVQEVVHDGSQFKGLYAGASSRALITNGFRFSVARQGGWTSSPTFETFAIDESGNEAV